MRPATPLPLLFASLFLASNAGGQTVGTGTTGATRSSGETLRDRVLVKLVRDPDLGDAATQIGVTDFDRLLRSVGATAVKPVFKRPARGRKDPAAAEAIGLDRWVRVELGRERSALELEEIVARFEELRSVDVAETDRVVLPTVIPNDPDYASLQWDLQPAFIDAENAWNIDTDSSEYVIFVIDTGVETTHGDIVANLWTNPGEIAGNGIDDDANGFKDDVHGWNFLSDNNDVSDGWPHGIHVNGTIGAATNNGLQVSGINWSCQLAQGKIFDQGFGTWEAGAAATTYATDNGAVVTNNSWGDTVPGPQVWDDAMDYADGADVLQVGAAGNQGDTNHFWPAAYDEFLSVSATDSGDNLAWFSTHGDWIDMSAPGDGIWNLWVNNSATWLSGTSMASPHVAGAGALLRSVNPQLTNHEARVTLRLFSDDIGTPGFDNDFGHGRLDLRKALDAARSISLSTRHPTRPGTVTVTMDAPTEANMVHVLLAGWSGIDPGLSLLGIDPNEHRTFPLNWDPLVSFQISNPTNAITPGFIDYLDANGQDTATFQVLPGNLFRNRTISLCFCTLDPNDLSTIRFISAPTSFEVP